MLDDKINPPENQTENQTAGTVFETIPVDEQPEEISAEVSSPEEAVIPPPEVSFEPPPMVYHENSNKFLIIIGAVIFFIVIFFFLIKTVFKTGTGQLKPTTIKYWGLWEDKEVIEPLIVQYQSKNKNITIEYEKKSPQEYREKLIARSQNGQGPDIFRFHNTWVPEIKEMMATLPSVIMTNDEFEKTFYPIHQKDLKVGGNYVGIPLTIDGLVLIYNDNLFRKAGITTASTNWNEVIDYAGKLTVKDKSGYIITSGIAIGTASNVEHFSDIFGLILLQNGGDLKMLNQEAAAGALESYRKFAEDPKNSFWDQTMPNSISAFAQEKLAMAIVPSWEIINIKTINPDIKIKVVPVPNVPGSKPLSIASYWVEGVSRYSKNQIEAWKFIKYLAEKDNMTKLYENQAKMRIFGEPYSRVDLAQTLIQNEYVGPVIQQAKYYVSIPTISRTYDNGLNDEIIRYIENAINATIQGTSYSEALNTAQQGVSQVFTRYKIE